MKTTKYTDLFYLFNFSTCSSEGGKFSDFGRVKLKAVKIQSLKWNIAFGCATTLIVSPQIAFELIKIRLLPILAPNFPPIIELYLKVHCVAR